MGVPGMTAVDRMDRQLVELQHLKFDRRDCPACNGLLETPTPLKLWACPVCRSGKLLKRKTDERWCPICRSGALKSLRNASPIKICPICGTGRLRPAGLLRKWFTCGGCSAEFSRRANVLTLEEMPTVGKPAVEVGTEGDSDEFWLPLSGRSAEITFCETCMAHWEEAEDGRMSLFAYREDPFGVAKKYRALSREEWARVGLRLKPDAGNLSCSKCDADFLLEGDEVVPLHTARDPYEFMAEHRGERLTVESLRFLGVYKTSGRDGPVCDECRTEFDSEGGYLRLRRTSHPLLSAHLEEARPLEDWHRIARGLPPIDEQAAWLQAFEAEVRVALLSGEIPWADRRKPEMIWNSDADLTEPALRGRLALFRDRIEFRCRKSPWSAPLDAIRSAAHDGDQVTLRVVGEPEPLTFRIEPETVSVDLASGRREIDLTAADFLAALRNCG